LNRSPEGNPVKVGGEVPAPWAVSNDTPIVGALARRRRELDRMKRVPEAK